MSTEERDEQAQRDALQQDIAYLDVLPREEDQLGDGDGDTDAALNSLFGGEAFNEGTSGQNNNQNQDDGGMDKEGEMSIEMTVGEAVADVQAQQSRVGVNKSKQPRDKGSSKIDPITGELIIKRKATSRINMLARGGACDYCKRRKLKCTAEQPRCSTCIRQDRDCKYTQKQQKSRVKVLEDRLAELEKKLGGTVGDGLDSSSSQIDPALTGGTINESSYPEGTYGVGIISSSTAASGSGTNQITPLVLAPQHEGGEGEFEYSDEVGMSSAMDLGFNLDILNGKEIEEPDLMTLADAATYDHPTGGGKYPWDGMTVDGIIQAILGAVGGGKGVGEKIVFFLLQTYVKQPTTGYQFLNPKTLLSRISPNSTSPLHPSLTLSLLSQTILHLPPLSPPSSTDIASLSTLSAALIQPARTYAAEAFSSGDTRLLDVLTGQAIRSLTFFHQSRFLDGWVEISGCVSLATAYGLGKLGGVGQRFLEKEERSEEWDEKCRIGDKSRSWQFRSMIIEPCKDKGEYMERIMLFWTIYVAEKCACIGWGWTSSFNDDEITTPLPLESYDTPESLRDTFTLKQFLEIKSVSGRTDNTFRTLIKSITILYRATRLLERDTFAHEDTQKLLDMIIQYISGMTPVLSGSRGEAGIAQGPVNTNWMILHAAKALIHAKEEVDIGVGKEARPFKEFTKSCLKVVEHIEMAKQMSGSELEGYDAITALTIYLVGRTAYKASLRLKGDKSLSTQIGITKMEVIVGVGDKCVEALVILGKKMRYAATCAQILENISLGQEEKAGEYMRTEWLNPS